MTKSKIVLTTIGYIVIGSSLSLSDHYIPIRSHPPTHPSLDQPSGHTKRYKSQSKLKKQAYHLKVDPQFLV